MPIRLAKVAPSFRASTIIERVDKALFFIIDSFVPSRQMIPLIDRSCDWIAQFNLDGSDWFPPQTRGSTALRLGDLALRRVALGNT